MYATSQILLNLTWLVVAGEESQEIEDQNKREMRELEAIYPRISSIPPKFDSSLAFYYSHILDYIFLLVKDILFLSLHAVPLCQWM